MVIVPTGVSVKGTPVRLDVMPKTRPPYAPEFRRRMIDLVRAGRDPDLDEPLVQVETGREPPTPKI